MVSISGDSIVGIIVSVVALVVLIGNAVYLNGVRLELERPGTTLNLSKTGADLFFFIDIILAIALGIYLIYNLWRIFTTREQRETIRRVATRSVAGRRFGRRANGTGTAGAQYQEVRTHTIPETVTHQVQ